MEREALDVDVLIVGGGPAGLSAALTLASLQQSRGGEPLAIAVLEKARDAGAHELSGAVLDPRALAELIPDYRAAGAPIEADVHEDRVYFLDAGGKIALPLIPPPLRNHGNHIVSLNRFTRWMATRVEEAGIDFFTGFAGVEVLWEGTRVSGVRTGDRGIDKEGRPKATFEAGVDIRAKVTIFCDGVRGNLTKQLLAKLPLAEGREPQQYAIGIKELWEVPADRIAAGTVMHTLGYPLRMEEFGGAFCYAMPEGRISLGLVVGLDYRDPMFDPYVAFQRLKEHPLFADLLAGGQRVKYGAKALPESGWNSVPQPWMDGGLIAGDAGAFMNSFRLKGIHLAMKTGMLAAETAFEAVRAGDTSGTTLRAYQDRIDRSWVREELYPVRNVHQAFNHGLLAGLTFSALTVATGGRIPLRLHGEPGHEMMKTRAEYYGSTRGPIAASNAVKADRVRTFDKVTSVHFSGTRHDEDQPVHLLVQTDVCYSRCGEEYGHPCQRFCPANVYEMLTNADGTKRLQINASNCVHCKTCDIMDPYQVITWVPPEGGGGPQYRRAVSAPEPDWKASRSLRAKASLIGAVGYPTIRLLGLSWRFVVDGREHLDRVKAQGQFPVMAFWHGRILPSIYFFRDRDIVVITSDNFDGEWTAKIIHRFGYTTARGSTSRNAARAALRAKRRMEEGHAVGITVDGPRGPALVVQPGALWLAKSTGNPIVPFHIEARSHWTAPSWDASQIPYPFSRVAVVFGEPFHVPADADEAALEAARVELGERMLALRPRALALATE